ncbi:MAG: hypothetical protein Q9161_009001 [Pseudevernia consocians]
MVMLLKAGADIHAVDHLGYTALHQAVGMGQESQEPIVRQLLSHSASLDASEPGLIEDCVSKNQRRSKKKELGWVPPPWCGIGARRTSEEPLYRQYFTRLWKLLRDNRKFHGRMQGQEPHRLIKTYGVLPLNHEELLETLDVVSKNTPEEPGRSHNISPEQLDE